MFVIPSIMAGARARISSVVISAPGLWGPVPAAAAATAQKFPLAPVLPGAGRAIVPAPMPTADARPELSQILAQEGRRRRHRIVLRWGLVVGLVGAVAAAVVIWRPRADANAPKYRGAAVVRGEVVHEVSATGRVEARSTVSVGAEISGRIATVEVNYNDIVKKGQVLARFDTASLHAQLDQSKASLAAARVAVEEAVLGAKQAHQERVRVDQLFAAGAVGSAERDNAVTADERAAAEVHSMRAQVALQHASFELASTNRHRAEILAPIDGVVLSRAVDPGQTVAASFQAPVLFVLAEDLAKMQVVAAIDEADVGQVQPGQAAHFTVDAFPDQRFEAVVTELRNSPVITQNVVTYEAILAVENPEHKLRPGMTASVKVVTASDHDALLVANAALRFVPSGAAPAEPGSHGVWLQEPGQAPRRVEVVVGVSDGIHTAVRGELAVGAEVLVDLATPVGEKAK